MTKTYCDKCGSEGVGGVFCVALIQIIPRSQGPYSPMTQSPKTVDLCGECKKNLETLVGGWMVEDQK